MSKTPANSGKFPPAPADLTPAATALWTSIVRSLPNTYFGPGDLPLLEAYCISHDRKRRLDARVEAESLLDTCCGHAAVVQSRAEAATMAALASKLRLCQSSRIRPDSASLRKAHNLPNDCDPRVAEYFTH